MANLNDLIKESFSEKSPDEAHELLRQIRLSRRTPPKKKKTAKKATKKKQKEMTPAQAAKLLEILEGRK
jgi:hypothetical protein